MFVPACSIIFVSIRHVFVAIGTGCGRENTDGRAGQAQKAGVEAGVETASRKGLRAVSAHKSARRVRRGRRDGCGVDVAANQSSRRAGRAAVRRTRPGRCARECAKSRVGTAAKCTGETHGRLVVVVVEQGAQTRLCASTASFRVRLCLASFPHPHERPRQVYDAHLPPSDIHTAKQCNQTRLTHGRARAR